MTAGGVATAPLVVPNLSPARLVAYLGHVPGARNVRTERHRAAVLPQAFADQFGWKAQVSAVARAYRSIAPGERARAVVLASNYGEAGAVDWFGPKLGLPGAYSPHNSYWLWGPPSRDPSALVTVGIPKRRLERDCGTLRAAPSPACRYCMPYESAAPIFVCRRPRRSLRALWPALKSFE